MRLGLSFVGYASRETEDANRAHCNSLRLPGLGGASREAVAIVGGGPSVEKHLDELRLFDGDVWAINGAWRYLADHGVDAWFVTIDPSEFVLKDAEGARKAILAKTCAPELFDLLKDGDVRVFDAQCGPTTVCEAVTASVQHGYKRAVFYGCESSYADLGKRHAYAESRRAETVAEILVGKQWFATQGDFLDQAAFLAAVIRMAPHVYSERSGGLLRALVEHGDYSDARIVKG